MLSALLESHLERQPKGLDRRDRVLLVDEEGLEVEVEEDLPPADSDLCSQNCLEFVQMQSVR